MNDVYTAIDWIFTNLKTFFWYATSNFVTASFILVSLLSLVVTIYLNSRQR